MDIEKIRDAVANEHADVAAEQADAKMVGEVNESHGPVRSLTIDVIESMCATARAEGFRDGYSRGVANAMQQRQIAEKWAERRGETAGVVAGLDAAIGVLERRRENWTAPASDEPVSRHDLTYFVGLASATEQELARLRDELRENGLHGEREF